MRLTIKTKLAAVFTVVVALSGVSMFMALESLGKLNDSLGEIANVRAANVIGVSNLQTALESAGSRMRAMIITSDTSAMDGYAADIDAEMATIAKEMGDLDRNVTNPAVREAMTQLRAKLGQYQAAVPEIARLSKQNSDAVALAISRSEGSATLGEVETSMAALKKALAARVSAGDMSAFAPYQAATEMFLTMTDPAAIGGGMALALLATLYGALIANLVAMPIAVRLRRLARAELIERARLEAPLAALTAVQPARGWERDAAA